MHRSGTTDVNAMMLKVQSQHMDNVYATRSQNAQKP
jgi:hypothetical protein